MNHLTTSDPRVLCTVLTSPLASAAVSTLLSKRRARETVGDAGAVAEIDRQLGALVGRLSKGGSA